MTVTVAPRRALPDPCLPSSLFMWVQPEITQKLYIALWAAFLASCFFPYRLVGLAVGKEGCRGPAAPGLLGTSRNGGRQIPVLQGVSCLHEPGWP